MCPYHIFSKLVCLLTNPTRRYLPVHFDISAVFSCTAPVPSSASAMPRQHACVVTWVPVGADGLGDLRALVPARVVFTSGEESSFHFFCNDVLDAIRRNASARFVSLRGASSTAYYVTIPATFARDHRTHGDHAVIIAFYHGPRDADHKRECTVHAFESFRIGRVDCALCAVLLDGYDGPEFGFVEVALATVAA